MKRENAAGKVAYLATAEPYERALPTLRGYAAALLDTGYPRDELYANFERARGVLAGRGAGGRTAPVVAQGVRRAGVVRSVLSSTASQNSSTLTESSGSSAGGCHSRISRSVSISNPR